MARMTKAQKAAEAAEAQRRQAEMAADRKHIEANRCPVCGSGIRRNLSLRGWYQCEQLGAVGFRKDASKPSCSWQTFVE